ncbi:MAG: bifunctional UDP-N-acetylglucosamine diphosphorylase/glucosamine-1-phosphate N-acetyltransferase GlmU [Synergistaceae bacterium]|nr:bifunctional UDP-N-acetylglucosamine diphosphorylase/glucosamine-1-phosphate N-acetyltransferase GlmU [Synergistaceae bacterium]
MNNLCVLVMAAGKGTRMKSAIPKVLQPVLDRPIIDYVLDTAQSAGVNPEDTAVLAGSGGEEVEAHITKNFPSVKILWQHEQLGTGHAVKSAIDWWKNYDSLVVLNGDLPLMKPESLRELLSFSGKNDCTVITFEAENPGAYGRIIRSENKSSVSIVEYKDASPEQKLIREVNAGCYIFKVKPLLQIIDLISNDNAQKEYYITDALGLMNERGMSTGAFILPEEEMQGVNTQAELAEVCRVKRFEILNHFMSEGVRIPDPKSVYIGSNVILSRGSVIMPNVQIWGNSRIGEGSVIGSGSILTNAIIGNNVNVIAYAVIENSTLKDNTKAGPFCYIRDGSCLEEKSFAGKFVELKNSIIGEGSKVPHLSYMGDATLGHDVNIGAGSITCNYDGERKNKTLIGSNCFVGSNTMFVAPVELSDGAATAAGSVITQKVPENSLGVGRARQKNIADWSLRNHHHKTATEGEK